MAGRICIAAPATALARVFLPSRASSARDHGRLGAQVPPFLAPRRSPMAGWGSTTPARPRAFHQRAPAGAPRKPGRLPRDDEITHKFVLLRQADGRLSEPQLTSMVLGRLSRRTESLVTLAMPGEADGSSGDGSKSLRWPVCKIVDRVAERKAEYDKARDLRKKKVPCKELEVNWAIDMHDLEHRMTKLREFLGRGLKVEVTLMRKGKKGKRTATQEEARAVVRTVQAAVAAVPGARTTKATEGEVLRTMKMYLEGPATAETAEA